MNDVKGSEGARVGGLNLPCTINCHSCALVKVVEDGERKEEKEENENWKEEGGERKLHEKKIYCKSEKSMCVCV